ncbi:MAG: matrixin family metalloprotease, partial [Planctomycetota bacterium]
MEQRQRQQLQRAARFEALESRQMMAADAIYYPGTPPERMLPDTHDDHDDGSLAFRTGNRWTTTATNGSGLQQGDPTTVTWSIVPDGGQSNLIARLDAIYGGGGGPLSARPWFPLVSSAFNSWTLQSGLKFVYEANDDNATMSNANSGALGVRGDIRINGANIDGNFGVLGFAFLPNYGDITLDTNDVFFANTSSNSIGLRNVLAHEVGHALGILHTCPIDQSKLMEPFYSGAFDGPQIDDILAINRLYGDRLEPNDTKALATNLGTLNSGTVTTSSVSVDGTSDTDLYSFTVTGTTGKRLSATLRPDGSSYLEGPQNSDGTCSAGSIFNSRVENNLSIEILDTDGSTVLAAATSAPAGVNEVLSGIVLPVAGTYFVRIKGATDKAQMYSFDLSVAVGSITGPTLIGIQPNAVGLFDVDNPFDFKVPTNNQLTVAPQQLTFRFDASSGLDPATLSGIELYRTGSDGRFDVAYGATDLGTTSTLSPAILDFSAVKLGQSENNIKLNFTAADLGANVAPQVTVTGQTIDVVLNTRAGVGSRSTAQMVVDALNQNVNSRVLIKTQLRGGLNGSADVAGIAGPVTVQLAGADVPKTSSSFGAPAPLEVRLTAVNATAGNPIAIGVYKAALGTAGVPQITV